MEHFNDILFRKSGPANKQHTNQPKMIYLTKLNSIGLTLVLRDFIFKYMNINKKQIMKFYWEFYKKKRIFMKYLKWLL